MLPIQHEFDRLVNIGEIRYRDLNNIDADEDVDYYDAVSTFSDEEKKTIQNLQMQVYAVKAEMDDEQDEMINRFINTEVTALLSNAVRDNVAGITRWNAETLNLQPNETLRIFETDKGNRYLFSYHGVERYYLVTTSKANDEIKVFKETGKWLAIRN